MDETETLPRSAAGQLRPAPVLTRILRDLPRYCKKNVRAALEGGHNRLQAQGRVDFALFNIRASLNP
jgi:hypothetical protein